jgi:hypothetical protein
MLRRYVFVKLAGEYREELRVLQILKTAREVLHAAHGVQMLHVGRAADEETRAQWDLCLTLEYVSDVDLQRSLKDPVVRAFEHNFLGPRTERVWSVTFEGDARGPRRARPL